MKEGWIYTTIGDSCDINYGNRVVRARDGGSIYDVYGGGGATFKMDTYNREDCVVIARFAMSKICTRSVKGKFYLNDSGLTITPKEGSPLQQFLLDKLILALNDTIYECGRGSAQRNLRIDEFKAIKFAYPLEVSEQARIVSYLDTQFAKIDALKANAEQQLQAAKDLFQSALKEYLTPKEEWAELYLVKEFDLKSGEYLPNKEQSGGNIPVYGGNGITGYHNKFNFIGEQILIGRVGALCGNIHYTNEKIWVTDNAFIMKGINDQWNIRFLTYELQFMDLNQYASQTAQPVISNKSMKDVLIYKPSLKEQCDIVVTLDSLSEKVKALQENYNKTLVLCNDLKQSLLKSIFE